MGGAANLTLEAQYTEQEIFADGRIAYTVASDHGLNGTLGMVTLDDNYEIDMGRKMKLANGLAHVEQKKNQKHAIYFETDGLYDDGERFTIKNWIYGVTSGKPNETYEQDTDSGINPQNYSISLNILGTLLMNSTGSTPYIDEKGNQRQVWWLSSTPEDPEYENFDKTVQTPKVEG